MCDRFAYQCCETLSPPTPTTSLSPIGWSYRHIYIYIYMYLYIYIYIYIYIYTYTNIRIYIHSHIHIHMHIHVHIHIHIHTCSQSVAILAQVHLSVVQVFDSSIDLLCRNNVLTKQLRVAASRHGVRYRRDCASGHQVAPTLQEAS